MLGSEAGTLESVLAGPRVAKPKVLTGSDRFGHAYHRLLLGADLAAIIIASLITVTFLSAIGRGIDLPEWILAAAVMLPVWFLIAYVLGLYSQVERLLDMDYVAEFVLVIVGATMWCWLLVLGRAVIVDGYADLDLPAAMWFLMIPAILLCRAGARPIARSRPWFNRSIALIGEASTVEGMDRRIDRHPEWGLRVGLEVVRMEGDRGWEVRMPAKDDDPADSARVAFGASEDMTAATLTKLVDERGIDRVMLAGGMESLSSRVELVHTMINSGIAVDYVSGGPETLYSGAIIQHLEGISLMSSRPSFPRPAGAVIKRGIDITLSAGFLIVTSPVLLASAIAIKLGSKGPVIFRQQRAGRDGDTFEIFKLRTMEEGADQLREALWHRGMHGNEGGMLKIKDDPRVTKVGKRLRRWSIDEIPQFWNVLIGDMSLVGPRPLPLDEASRIGEKYEARNRVRPGITGPWQVMGRSDIPMEDMLKLDFTYVTGWSLGEDFRILLRTLPAVSGKSGGL